MSMLQQASSQLASDALSLTNVSVNWRAWSFTSLGLFRPNLRITKEGKETYVVTCVLRCVGLEIPRSLCKSFRSISLLKQTYSQKHVGSIAVWYFTFITLSLECGALEVQCKGSRRKSSCYQQPERNMGSLWRSSQQNKGWVLWGHIFAFLGSFVQSHWLLWARKSDSLDVLGILLYIFKIAQNWHFWALAFHPFSE